MIQHEALERHKKQMKLELIRKEFLFFLKTKLVHWEIIENALYENTHITPKNRVIILTKQDKNIDPRTSYAYVLLIITPPLCVFFQLLMPPFLIEVSGIFFTQVTNLCLFFLYIVTIMNIIVFRTVFKVGYM